LKIVSDIRKYRGCTTGINDTGGKFANGIIGINDTGRKFATGTAGVVVANNGNKIRLLTRVQ
jgi:hypothetical protein